MGKPDPRIDAIIAKAQPFARPILTHLRKLVHRACPEVEETVKWGMPFFLYRGLLCNMASFKAHATFGFWKGSLIVDRDPGGAEGMGQFGKIASLADLPGDKAMLGYIKAAMKLNEEGAPSPTRGKAAKPKPPIKPPAGFLAALRKNPEASAAYRDFSPSHKREYLEWITEAKTEATREKRQATAIAWMAEGKTRLWKYARK